MDALIQNYAIVILLILLVVMLIIPFIPGLLELYMPKDDKPLFINVNYSKDPGYFGSSFKSYLEKAIGIQENPQPGEYDVYLSRPEKIRISHGEKIDQGESVSKILYVMGNLRSGDDVELEKEVFTSGSVIIGNRNTVRAIYSEGHLYIGRDSKIIRWIDSESDIEIAENCNLGMSAATQKNLIVGKGAQFTRLYGQPVATYKTETEAKPSEPLQDISEFAFTIESNQTIVPPSMIFTKDIIARQNLVIRQDCIIEGSIKVYGDLTIEDNVTVNGDLFVEGNVRIGHHSVILGNIFSQGHINLEAEVQIGEPQMVKSVISKRDMTITANTLIYGYLMTDRRGIVV